MKFIPFLILLLSCTETAKETVELQILEPLLVSTAAPEFAFSINVENTEFFFNRAADDRSWIKIMTSKLVDGQQTTPETMQFSDGSYRDVDPFLSHDNKRLYFSSTRPFNKGGKAKDFDTWYVERTENGWSEPVNPGAPLNSDSTEIFFTMAKNGNAYFVSEFDGKRGIVVSRLIDGERQAMERIDLKLNGQSVYASNPCVASDESFLIVASRALDEKKPPNLFISFKTDEKWSELYKLGPEINSDYADFAPALSKDDQYLYFTSERPGIMPKMATGIRPPGDIYKINLVALIKK